MTADAARCRRPGNPDEFFPRAETSYSRRLNDSGTDGKIPPNHACYAKKLEK